MTFRTGDLVTFQRMIAHAVESGLTFEAFTDESTCEYVIVYTGGF